MAKKQARQQGRQSLVTLDKGIIALLVVLALILIAGWGRMQAGSSFIAASLLGMPTPTPSPTSTFTPSPTLTPTPSPTATPSLIYTPTPLAQFNSPVTPLISPSTAPAEVPLYTYRVVNSYPHDPEAYIQGLVYEAGFFYEGTGRLGQSSLRKVDIETGEVLQRINLAPVLFGEGITIFGENIIQLTWKSRVGFVYDKESFELIKMFAYPTEGWGITHDGERLIMSDGTANLYFWDPDTLAEIGRVEVTDNGQPVVRLNELEYINDEVWANVWQTDRIARIDPNSGRVVGWIDLTGLLSAEDRAQQPVDVLNGIAYDAENDRLFVTGKLWPKLFEI
jgi:glutamine cyclotransferase